MKGKHEKNSGWRKLLVLSLVVMMAVMFMPASALADGADGGTQSAASASQSVDKGNTGTGDTGSEAAEQKTEEKEVNQGAADAVQTSSEQQNQLAAAGTSSETAAEKADNGSSDVPQYLKTQLENERKAAFDSDCEASIGGKPYKTIDDALSEAKDGATITLLRDIDRDFEIAAYSKTDPTKTVRSIDKGGIDIPSGKNITLNLNAHQVMTSPENGHKYSIKVASGSTVRIVNQPTDERKNTLKKIDSNDVQETQKEVKGEAVLSSGIINEGTVTLDNTQGKIYLNNDNGYSFYNRGTLILQGDYSTGYPPALSWLRLTLNIIEQTKAAKVSFADGFDADQLSFQLPDEVLSELNDGTLEDDYTVAESGSDKVKALMDKNYTTDALYHVQGLTNSKVSLEQSGDKIVLRCLKTAVYLDPENGDDKKNDGTASDKAVKTLDKALLLYNKSNGSAEIHVLNTVDVTSDITLPEGKKTSDSKTKAADVKRIRFVRENSFKGTLFHISSQGKLELSDVTVDGKNVSAEAPLIWVSDGGSLILHDGAVLKNNRNNANGIACGGAVYAEGTNTKVLMDGGEIRSCRAVWGGGIFLRDASLTMNGGTISDNTASDYLDTSADSTSNTEKETKDEKDQLGTGGGVCIAYNAVMNMSGGTVSGNTARRGGGVSAGVDQSAVLKDTEDHHRAFTMSGGTISDNIVTKYGSQARNVAGGGIYVACRNVAEITAGSISGNRGSNAFGYSGGGIYVNGGAAAVEDENGKPYSNGVLKTQDVYLGGNRDGGNGAAIAVCPTSHLKLYYDGNVVIDPAGGDTPDLYIQYIPDGEHQAQKDENGVAYVGYYLSSVMQDGSPYNWTEKAGRSFETDTNAKLTKDLLQLEAHPSADAVNRNKASCTVFITGNSVGENGGGIAANGDLDFGSKPTPETPTPTPTPSPTYRHVTVQKTWTLDDGKTRPDSIQVQLMKNGVAYGSPVTLNDANSWTFTWNNLDNDGSQWTVNEVLVPQGFTESQKTTGESDGLKVVINNDDQPTKPNKPTNPKTPGKTNKTVNPKTPAKTNTSVTPKTPAIHRTVMNNTSSAPASSAPRTSDSTRLGTMLIVFGGAAALLALLLAVKRRKVSK